MYPRQSAGPLTHLPTGLTLRFGELARSAALVPPPAQVKLKEPRDWTLIGTPRKSVEALDKITGKPVYAIDVRLPNMLYAAIIQSPVWKGTLRSIDAEKIAAMKGLRRVVAFPDFVAVVADSWWQAKKVGGHASDGLE
jgi:isoquinoline 1-oxidoreductase beta subunit